MTLTPESWLEYLFSSWPEGSSLFRVHQPARDEASSTVGDGSIFLELCIENPHSVPPFILRLPTPTPRGTFLLGGREFTLVRQLDFRVLGDSGQPPEKSPPSGTQPLQSSRDIKEIGATSQRQKRHPFADLTYASIELPALNDFRDFVGWLRDNRTTLDSRTCQYQLLEWEARLNGNLRRKSLLDDTNPLAEVAHRRKLLIPGKYTYGLRFVHPSHYGRLCPLETPESERIGLQLFLASGAELRADKIVTPYRSRVSGERAFLSIEEEAGHTITACRDASADGRTLVRRPPNTEVASEAIDKVDLMDALPAQFLGFSSLQVPFIHHSDGARAMMGGKNLKQAIPLVAPELPLIRTGYEEEVATLSGRVLISEASGTVLDTTASEIVVRSDDGDIKSYPLEVITPGNKGCHFHDPRVTCGQVVRKGTVLADGAATRDGELALGLNVLVAYMPFHGYNFEDGIVVSESLARRFTSRHVYRVTHEPEASENLGRRQYDSGQNAITHDSVIKVGDDVRPGTVLFQIKRSDGYAENQCWDRPFKGQVIKATMLASGTLEIWIEAHRALAIGDKLTGRHGNKGVVTRIVPEDEMPWFVLDGRRYAAEAVLNPLGIISRMNLGQLWETHGSWLVAAGRWDSLVGAPFRRANLEELRQHLAELGLPDGKAEVFLGDRCVGKVVVGHQYLAKLDHIAADKLRVHIGGLSRDYSSVTGQPRRGQRLGEMEVWALLSHGASSILDECLVAKSDRQSRLQPTVGGEGVKRQAGSRVPGPNKDAAGLPEVLRVLRYYLRGVGAELSFIPDGPASEVQRVSLRLAPSSEIASWSSGHVIRTTHLVDPHIFGSTSQELCERMGHIPLPVPILHPWLASPGALEMRLGKRRWASLRRESKEYRLSELPKKSDAQNRTGREQPATDVAEGDPRPGKSRGSGSPWCKPYGIVAERLEKAETALEDQGEGAGRLLLAEWLYDRLSQQERDRCFLEVIPVIPAGLRPDVETEENHLNRLYRMLLEEISWKPRSDDPSWARISRVQRIYSAVRRLMVGGEKRRSRTHSIVDHLEGKFGLLRHSLQGKRQDFSARAVIVPDPELRLDECGLPFDVAWPLLGNLAREVLLDHGKPDQVDALVDAAVLGDIAARAELQNTLNQLILEKDVLVLLNRQPTLHKYGVMAFRPRVRLDHVLAIPPLVCGAFNADFDGDTMAIHLPISREAQEEAHRLLPSVNLFKASNGDLVLHFAQDLVLGVHLLGRTPERLDRLKRVLGHKIVGSGVDRLALESLVADRVASESDLENLQTWLHGLQEEAFSAATDLAGEVSFGLFDLSAVALSPEQKKDLVQIGPDIAGSAGESVGVFHRQIEDAVWARLRSDPANPVSKVILSGSRGNRSQARQLVGMVGRVIREDGSSPQAPIPSSFLDGLEPLEYWILSHQTRRVMLDKQMGTPEAGELTRCLVEGTYELAVVEPDCGTANGVVFKAHWFQSREHWLKALVGRCRAGEDSVLAPDELAFLRDRNNVDSVGIRSPLTCESRGGICQRCYGWDLAHRDFPRIGSLVGLSASQSIGERGTQLSLQTFHSGVKGLDMSSVQQVLVRGFAPDDHGSRTRIAAVAGEGPQAVLDRSIPRLLAPGAYGQGVSPVHFEIIFSVMHRHGWQSLEQIAGNWKMRGFLASAAYSRAGQVLRHAALTEVHDTLSSLKSRLMLGAVGRNTERQR